MNKTIHIISFNVPYPANYGGVIDVFYKIKNLCELGYKVHLHCFVYNRPAASILEKYCASVQYYPRANPYISNLSFLPYIVKSRSHKALLKNLLKDDAPILFEGLHTCYYINHTLLKNRIKIYRESNIEHHYYQALAAHESNFIKKIYYLLESKRLELFEKKLEAAKLIFTVNTADESYFKKLFNRNIIENIYSFHPYNECHSQLGVGKYILFHGNLSINENHNAAMYLIEYVFSKINYTCVIAGLQPNEVLQNAILNHKNISLISNPDSEEMEKLIADAHIHALYTDQATGLKLKLLHALYNGRFCIVNNKMLYGVPDEINQTVSIVETDNDFVKEINLLMQQNFSESDLSNRKAILSKHFDNMKNAERLVSLIQQG